MWWLGVVVAQTQEAIDPLNILLKSSNPAVVGVGLLLATLFGADKVAFWYTKLKGRQEEKVAVDCSPEVKKSVEALADVQRDLAHTVAEVAKTIGRLEEYCQRHFEQTGLELRSVREELRAIRERMKDSAHGGPNR